MGKFLCVKGVVFFTWWQGVAIVILQGQGIIQTWGKWNADDVANGLQDCLICVEMFCFAIAHSFTFTHEEYHPNHVRGSTARGSSDSNSLMNEGGGVRVSEKLDQDDKDRQKTFNDQQGSGLGTEDDTSVDDSAYTAPIIRTLHAPMTFREAFWSSTFPKETLKDIKRLRNGVSDQIMSRDHAMISMASLQHAESI